MKLLLYHVPLVMILAGAACGGPRPAASSTSTSSAAIPASSPAPNSASAARGASASAAQAPTATSAAIERGKAIIEQVRAAAGGAAVTSLRSIRATGTSEMTALKVPRTLTILALYPAFYRQDEAPTRASGRGFHTTFGLQDTQGWITGAALGGEGRSKDPERVLKAYTRAARQAFAGFMAGINPAWLMDTGHYTVIDAGAISGGDDNGALTVDIEGPDGKAGRLVVDPRTHLPRRFIEPPQPTGGGPAARSEAVFTYSGFAVVDGVQLPRSIVRQIGNGRTIWTITKYELNPKIATREFSRIKR